jgi:hypothetical protein
VLNKGISLRRELTQRQLDGRTGIVMFSYYVAADRQRMSLLQAAKHASRNAGSGMFVQTYVSKQSWSRWHGRDA